MVILGLVSLFLFFVLGIMFMLAWGAYSYREDELHKDDKSNEEER
jgi:hypothetical protein